MRRSCRSRGGRRADSTASGAVVVPRFLSPTPCGTSGAPVWFLLVRRSRSAKRTPRRRRRPPTAFDSGCSRSWQSGVPPTRSTRCGRSRCISVTTTPRRGGHAESDRVGRGRRDAQTARARWRRDGDHPRRVRHRLRSVAESGATGHGRQAMTKKRSVPMTFIWVGLGGVGLLVVVVHPRAGRSGVYAHHRR